MLQVMVSPTYQFSDVGMNEIMLLVSRDKKRGAKTSVSLTSIKKLKMFIMDVEKLQ